MSTDRKRRVLIHCWSSGSDMVNSRYLSQGDASMPRQRGINDLLRLLQDQMQMILVLETLRVYLVDVFGARGSCGKPAAGRNDLDTADGRLIARRVVQYAVDLLAGQLGALHLLRRQLRQRGFLL